MKLDNLYANLGGGICIIFIMAQVGNLYKDQRVTLVFFVMAEVGNLDTCLGVTLVYFHNGRGG